MIRFRYLIFLGVLFFSCKTNDTPLTVPEPAQSPQGALRFERLEAQDPDRFTLYFALELENPRAEAAAVAVTDWRLTINDRTSPQGASLRLIGENARVTPYSRASFSLGLDLDMAKFPLPRDAQSAEYEAALQIALDVTFERQAAETVLVRGAAVIPRIQEPEFTITAIAVSRAEQTRFRVSLQIANPNDFPLELSSLTYTFYGNGAFWADGKKELFLPIPPGSSAETQVFLMAGALDPRSLWHDELDELKKVQYRLTGESTIHTNIMVLPAFRMDFDLSRPSAPPQPPAVPARPPVASK